MKRIIILSGVILLILLINFYQYTSKNIREEILMIDNVTSSNTTITIVYDNYEYDKRLSIGFGFSCLVKIEDKNILFDTGGDSPILLNNLEKSGVDLKEIDIIVLSHIHGDHTGGLTGVLEVNPDVTVYIPKSFPNNFKEEIKSYGASSVDVSNSIKIWDGVYSTGELGTWIREQSLIIKTDKGLVVITGCAHPGVVNIVKKAKEITKDDVYLVTGGFHLGEASDSEINSIIESFRNLGVKKTAPCHCTGDRAIRVFEEEYKENFIKAGVGRVIKI
jgi:7,8-dihydropterin-6-yl-methyl-4-(beta-D-ribofuranosyl)aminobenzene 5'-phosphate synthase